MQNSEVAVQIMQTFIQVFLVIVSVFLQVNGEYLRHFPQPINLEANGIDYGDPLFLTPLIKAGQLKEARMKSRVQNLPGVENLESYSGFLTINETYDSNTFFWFFPSKEKTAPVVLWLQGGPGVSSLFGLFVENGPIEVTKDIRPLLRKYSWTNVASMLYIDNPVGTGFSFTKKDAGYVTNEVQIGDALYEALGQFFTIFSDYKRNPFYITGESYAGKYLPALGYRIHKSNPAGINFKGMAIGDGWSDPVTMFDYGDYLYQIGLLDENQRNEFKLEQAKGVKLVKEGKFMEALNTWNLLINTLYPKYTGLSDPYNFLYTSEPETSYYQNYLELPETRRAIHVGNLTFNNDSVVLSYMNEDFMKSVKPWIETLMDSGYKVLIYSGQLDVVVAVPLTESFLRTVKWKYAKEYRRASRSIWKVEETDTEVAGYVRSVHNFSQVIVRNAGHMVPYDQPRAALDLITKFLNNQL